MSSNSQNRRKLNDDHDEVMKSYLVNGIKAGAVAGVGATAAVFGLQRYTTLLRNFSPSAKLATILTFALGTTVIAAENAVYLVRRPTLTVFKTEKEEDLKKASWPEWAFHYRHPIFGGTFAAAVAAGALFYSHDPYRSGTQKFLNIRLYGQGLALAALFGSIGVGSIVAQRQQLLAEEKEKQAAERLYGEVSQEELLQPTKKKT